MHHEFIMLSAVVCLFVCAWSAIETQVYVGQKETGGETLRSTNNHLPVFSYLQIMGSFQTHCLKML